MGASIHTHIEYKAADGRWLHWGAPHVKPNYRLFALIAGVRSEDNGIRAMIPCRGLPKDASETTLLGYTQDALAYGLHHDTWLGADEFAELQKRWTEMNPDWRPLETDFEESVFRTYGPGGSALASHQGFEDMRAIFWFDD